MIAAHFDDILDKSYISCQIGQYTINKKKHQLFAEFVPNNLTVSELLLA